MGVGDKKSQRRKGRTEHKWRLVLDRSGPFLPQVAGEEPLLGQTAWELHLLSFFSREAGRAVGRWAGQQWPRKPGILCYSIPSLC